VKNIGTVFEPTSAQRSTDELIAQADAFERAVTRLLWLERKMFVCQLERFDLTPAQYLALVQLARSGPACTMGHLAAHLHQSSATMTGIVDRLVRQALAERCQDVADRRRVNVSLTEGGRRLLAEAGAAKRQRTAEILATFAGPDRHFLVALLEAYSERVAERLADEEAGRSGALAP
jgi:DNA-binding MarR family transcriptional regulator